MSVSMIYGTPNTRDGSRSEVIASGTLLYVDGSDDESVVVNMQPGGLYLLSYNAITTSTGEVYSGRIFAVQVPDGDDFGTEAVTHTAILSEGTAAVTMAWDDDSTMTLTPVANRTIYYSVRRLV